MQELYLGDTDKRLHIKLDPVRPRVRVDALKNGGLSLKIQVIINGKRRTLDKRSRVAGSPLSAWLFDGEAGLMPMLGGPGSGVIVYGLSRRQARMPPREVPTFLERGLIRMKELIRVESEPGVLPDVGEVEPLLILGEDGDKLKVQLQFRYGDPVELQVFSEAAPAVLRSPEGHEPPFVIRNREAELDLKATLRPYQESGLSWLKFIHDLGSGGVLADDMGLGKTVQTIALLLAIKQEEKKLRALIVAPTSVVTNWERELARFSPDPQGRALARHRPPRAGRGDQGGRGRHHELRAAPPRRGLPRGPRPHVRDPRRGPAHQEPDERDRRRREEAAAKRRLALTGTPIENRLSEIWSIFDFVSPGLLGPLDKFEQRFSRPIEAGDYKAAQRLRATIHPFILRRTKQEVAKDLPEKIEMDQICDLRASSAVYLKIAREVRAQVLGEVERVGLAKSQLQILAGLTRLRQAACDPRLLGPARASSPTRTPASSWRCASSSRRPSRAGTSPRLQPVRDDAPAHREGAEGGRDHLRVPRRLHEGPPGARRALPERPERPRVPHQPQGGRHGPQPHGRRHGRPLRPVVEPGRRAAGHRPRAPHRPDQGRDRVPARRGRHHRGEDPPAQGEEARARRDQRP
jgi:hypothetical protein